MRIRVYIAKYNSASSNQSAFLISSAPIKACEIYLEIE